MSIPITSTAEWLRCIRGTSAEHRAAPFKLVRMLSGDDRRPRPPVSLPGQPVMPTAPPPATTPAAPTGRYFRQTLPMGKVVNAPSKESDGRGPYTARRLRRMDSRFHHALERAIAHGQERAHA